MSDGPSPVEGIASSVTAAINNAPAVKETAQQQEAARTETMRATMLGMEAARDKIGNFCVSLSSPAVILAAPLQETYSDQAMVSSAGGERRSNSYVLATDQGFFVVDLHQEMYRGRERSSMTRPQQAYQVSQIIERALRGDAKIANSAISVNGYMMTINKDTRDQATLRIQEADQATVDKALALSIALARQQFQPQIDRYQRAMHTAGSVQDQIGMPRTAPVAPQSEPVVEPPKSGWKLPWRK